MGGNHQKWRTGRSVEWILPEQALEAYSEYRMRSLWFDAVVTNWPVPADQMTRLNVEKAWNDAAFKRLTDDWAKDIVKEPPEPFHPAPAPSVSALQPPVPSFLPPQLPPPPPPAPKPSSVSPESPPSKPANPMDLKAISEKILRAMAPPNLVLTYRQIAARSRSTMDDVILGLEELNRQGKVILIKSGNEPTTQRAYRTR